MMQYCPSCGSAFQNNLNDGLVQCDHCGQVFDSSDYNKLLSAAWAIRREKMSLEKLKWQLQLGDDFSILVHTFVHDYEYSHQDFMNLLKKLGVANKSYLKYS
jgi:uncharacterized C2H2 Zn-finger protein